ncbi:hypothetical protein AYR54_06975 [Loigolactobacillus backii]|uniref:Wzz/FepE/Etk N-terminal domain-containing protein n=2 Tax=Loigolactobacillus backii TaxID=375175 RepID=UPI0007F12737|nr:Wzz/FepE/Etk N-terminal domain-containing protein [Loigolactobacillus backii]ANK60126.1 hypothetical protein AYR52_07570 [Loigolactobacillus backii]ANK65008.1 hypothetical protein AYR54_06975 [Loigolactobacillus backii]ANK67565.1 hypothetical protein AYR55_07575 [Loigolactobacillus backii]OLF69905.1 hypothetical protein ACX53_05675 [Loigolactobacillus backii]PIO87206.1 hypothetical protein B8A32_08680 [Loigolactobacillus backii]
MNETLDLEHILGILRKHVKTIVWSTVLVTALAFIITFFFLGLCQIVLVEILNGTFTSVNVLFVYS